jgi:glycerol-3-phosphate dehydrogenase
MYFRFEITPEAQEGTHLINICRTNPCTVEGVLQVHDELRDAVLSSKAEYPDVDVFDVRLNNELIAKAVVERGAGANSNQLCVRVVR